MSEPDRYAKARHDRWKDKEKAELRQVSLWLPKDLLAWMEAGRLEDQHKRDQIRELLELGLRMKGVPKPGRAAEPTVAELVDSLPADP